MRYSAIVPSPFTFDVLPIAKRTVAVATLAAAWGSRRSNHLLKGFDPSARTYSRTVSVIAEIVTYKYLWGKPSFIAPTREASHCRETRWRTADEMPDPYLIFALTWLVGDVPAERLREQPVEAQFAALSERRQADGHSLVPGFRRRPVGAEQPVPPRQIKAEVAVGLARRDRMMHAVHVGRHHDQAQHAVEPGRHRHVAVVEQRGGVEHHLEHKDRDRRNAKSDHHRDLDQHGKQDFDRMKPHAGGHVDVEVGVMHAMQAPQQRHHMERDVLRVDREIEGEESQQRGE